ncbi:MAG TPA: hypothetical protein VHO84_11290 [Syntrophorhabdaceae bacterium]|nr:hypothetical protein [Syntrophorhabdaceae bacterium]
MKTNQIRIYECRRCSHEWINKTDDKPKLCPECNSPLWDKEPAAKKNGNIRKSDNVMLRVRKTNNVQK